MDLQKVQNLRKDGMYFDQILKLLSIALNIKENINSLINQKGTDIIIQKLIDFYQTNSSE